MGALRTTLNALLSWPETASLLDLRADDAVLPARRRCRRPSGLKATPQTAAVCPWRVRASLPLPASPGQRIRVALSRLQQEVRRADRLALPARFRCG